MYWNLKGDPSLRNDKKPTNLRYLRPVPPAGLCPRLRGIVQASITVVGVRTQIWLRIAEIIKHSGIRGLIIEWLLRNSIIFRGKNSPFLALGFLIAWGRPEWKSVQTGENKTKRNWNRSYIFRRSITKIWVLLTPIFGWDGDEPRSHKRGTRKDRWVMVAQKEVIRCPVSLKSQILLKRLILRVLICRTFYSYCILQQAYILFQYWGYLSRVRLARP